MHSTAAAERLERDFGILCRPGLHCSPCAHRRLGTFPEGTVRDIRRIRTTNVPGAPTGTLFVSGSRDATAGDDGYYIARLDAAPGGKKPKTVDRS